LRYMSNLAKLVSRYFKVKFEPDFVCISSGVMNCVTHLLLDRA
jgi:hypothetical protein